MLIGKTSRVFSPQIDILIMHPNYTSAAKNDPQVQYLPRIVKALKKIGFLTDDISQGNSKYMGVCRLFDEEKTSEAEDTTKEEEEIQKTKHLHRRIDLRMIPYENYYCGLLYFTGSDFFNQQMRKIALDRGFTLNEYALCPVGSTGVKGDPIPVHSEEEIFELLEMTFKTPEERNLISRSPVYCSIVRCSPSE